MLFETHPIWNIDPKHEPLKTIGQYSHLCTWPALPDPKAQTVIDNYIIANRDRQDGHGNAHPRCYRLG
jgi:hypothetical protein